MQKVLQEAFAIAGLVEQQNNSNQTKEEYHNLFDSNNYPNNVDAYEFNGK